MKRSKEQNLFDIESFCNNVKVFSVTFDQFKASLLNNNKKRPKKKNSNLTYISQNNNRKKCNTFNAYSF